jgi:hypothetical protein
MRGARFALLAVLVLAAVCVTAQQTASPQTATSTQTALLQSSATAMSGGTAINDVTMNGTATYSGGPTPESDSITLIAIGNQQSQFLATTPSGSISEVRTVTAGTPSGSGSGPGGVSYKIADRDLLVSAAWFFPYFLVSSAATSSGYATSDFGQEVRNGVTVHHIQIWQQQNGAPTDQATALQQLSTEDIYLDPVSNLPVALTFQFAYLPMEVRFSNYTSVGSQMLAQHIQLFANSTLNWDMQISSIAVNTGVTLSNSQSMPSQ